MKLIFFNHTTIFVIKKKKSNIVSELGFLFHFLANKSNKSWAAEIVLFIDAFRI